MNMRTFLLCLPSIICAIAASTLAFYDKDGWGWFLVLALISSPFENGARL